MILPGVSAMAVNLAVLVGIDSYNVLPALPACANDLELMNCILEDTQKFDDILLLDGSPESNLAKERISDFIRKHQESEVAEFFFYYTGHGTKSGEDFLYLFSDYVESKSEQTSLRNSELDQMIKSVAPELTVKTVDACHSGTNYIKSEDNLKAIVDKSLGEFKQAYFLFSSQSEKPSFVGDDDKFSVFTRSFAEAIVAHKASTIRYRDIIAYISDDPAVKRHQTPMFIMQAKNTERFCKISENLLSSVRSVLEIDQSGVAMMETDDRSDESNVTTGDKDIIKIIQNMSKTYCTEDSAQESLALFIASFKKHTWPNVLNALYEISVEDQKNYNGITGLPAIGTWLKGNRHEYFARTTFEQESYEEKERIEIEEGPTFMPTLMRTKRYEYEPVTKFRQIVSGIELTAPSPSTSIRVDFEPKEQILSWMSFFFIFLFSKSKFVLFYKSEKQIEKNWKDRTTQNNNEWKVKNSCLTDSTQMIQSAKASIEELCESLIAAVSEIANQ